MASHMASHVLLLPEANCASSYDPLKSEADVAASHVLLLPEANGVASHDALKSEANSEASNTLLMPEASNLHPCQSTTAPSPDPG